MTDQAKPKTEPTASAEVAAPADNSAPFFTLSQPDNADADHFMIEANLSGLMLLRLAAWNEGQQANALAERFQANIDNPSTMNPQVELNTTSRDKALEHRASCYGLVAAIEKVLPEGSVLPAEGGAPVPGKSRTTGPAENNRPNSANPGPKSTGSAS